MTTLSVRFAELDEVDALAQLWYDGWHEAHAHLSPAELTRLRTFDSFRDRLHAALDRVRVVGAHGSPDGFSMIKENELDQLYVAAHARGSGAAAALIDDVEARLRNAGVTVCWLACAIGNHRAARFYEKRGWTRTGTMINHAPTSAGPFPLEVWRYEKRLQ